MPRIFLWLGIGLIVVVVIVVAVIFLTRQPTTQNGTTAPKTTTITIWQPIDSEDIWRPIINEYLLENKNVKIVYVQKPIATYEQEVVDALAAGQGPDIWAVHNSWMVKHKDKLAPAPDGLLRISDKDKRSNASIVKNTYAPIAAQESIFGDKLYGLPMSIDTLALYTNPRIFSERQRELNKNFTSYDPVLFSIGPRTWDEFVSLSKLLVKRDGSNVTQASAALGTATNNIRAVDILAAMMLQNGTKMESPDKLTATFNLPAKKSTGEDFNPGLNGLDFYTSFANPQKETYSWNNSYPEALEAFLQGKVAMIFGYSWLSQTITQRDPEFQYKIFPFPQIRGSAEANDFADYWFESVSKSSKNTPAAWQFVKFAASRGLAFYLSSASRPTPLKIQSNELPPSILDRNYRGSPFRFQPSSAVSWYRGKNPDQVKQTMAEMIEDVVSRGLPLDNALNKGATTITEIFRATTPTATPTPSPTK